MGGYGAVYCEHANESPSSCPCESDCYCRIEGNCGCRAEQLEIKACDGVVIKAYTLDVSEFGVGLLDIELKVRLPGTAKRSYVSASIRSNPKSGLMLNWHEGTDIAEIKAVTEILAPIKREIYRTALSYARSHLDKCMAESDSL